MKEYYECSNCSEILNKKEVTILYEGNQSYRGLNPIFYCKKCWNEFNTPSEESAK